MPETQESQSPNPWENLNGAERALLNAYGGEIHISLTPTEVRACDGHGNAAILLHQILFFAKDHHDSEGWSYIKQDYLEHMTGLGCRAQRLARKILVSLGFLDEKLKGVPAQMYYRPNLQSIISAWIKSTKSPVLPPSEESSFATTQPSKLSPLVNKQASPSSEAAIIKDNTKENIKDTTPLYKPPPKNGGQSEEIEAVPFPAAKKKRPGRQSAPRSTIDPDFRPNEKDMEFFNKEKAEGRVHYDSKPQVKLFVTWHQKYGTLFADWHAAFRNWLLKAEEIWLEKHPEHNPQTEVPRPGFKIIFTPEGYKRYVRLSTGVQYTAYPVDEVVLA